MATTSSTDDPMDLGPFLQNFVMKNPFRAQQTATFDGCKVRGKRVGDGATPRWTRLTAALRARRRAKASALNGSNGDDDDVEKISTQSADWPLHNADTSSPGDVTAWLRDNYRLLSVPGRHRVIVQHLLLQVQQAFPQVTADTIDDFVTATFPGCAKMNRKNGLSFYHGLVARPDPEVYENPLFIAALDSVTSQLLTTSQAAEKFGIRESALIAALSWCDGDGEDRCASVPTTSDSAVTVSTSNVQSDAVVSNAGRKRAYLTDSAHDSLNEPQCHHFKSSVDDTVDFEMMLQDISSSGENPKLDDSVLQPLLKDSQSLSQEFVTVKSEPGCNSPNAESNSQPLDCCLSVNSLQNATADGSNSCLADDDKIQPSSSSSLSTVSASTPPLKDSGDAESVHLQKELAAALATNLALQEELSARDFHLAQLAEDFFCLHEQFKQLARHFQAVLGDIQPLSDQSSVSQIARNHTS